MNLLKLFHCSFDTFKSNRSHSQTDVTLRCMCKRKFHKWKTK